MSVRLRTKWLWVRARLQSLNLRYRACFEQGVPWHSGIYRVWIHSETREWHDKNTQLIDCVNIWKTSEAANLVFQWIFVLNSVKHNFFPVSIENLFTWIKAKVQSIGNCKEMYASAKHQAFCVYVVVIYDIKLWKFECFSNFWPTFLQLLRPLSLTCCSEMLLNVLHDYF